MICTPQIMNLLYFVVIIGNLKVNASRSFLSVGFNIGLFHPEMLLSPPPLEASAAKN